jgi:hypothetical protein
MLLPRSGIFYSCKRERHILIVHSNGSDDASETMDLEVFVIHLHIHEEDFENGKLRKFQSNVLFCDSVGPIGHEAQRHLDSACRIAAYHIAQFAW